MRQGGDFEKNIPQEERDKRKNLEGATRGRGADYPLEVPRTAAGYNFPERKRDRAIID